MSPMEEIACGYCQLLIHLPFVQFVLTVMLWLMLLSVRLSLPLQAIPSPISEPGHLSAPAPLQLFSFCVITTHKLNITGCLSQDRQARLRQKNSKISNENSKTCTCTSSSYGDNDIPDEMPFLPRIATLMQHGRMIPSWLLRLPPHHTGSSHVPKQPRQSVPASDGADYLKTIPGFSQIRAGGTNGAPVFRGMFGSRLRILANNGEVLGACPAGMDAPTSYISPESFDLLTITKGPQRSSGTG
ncbi:TonB-dependent copper receptor (plasmid) [Klebsiella pneumoniae]|nr:TonB-dependent copper receptor [Klebsiella pneumoniae]